MLLWVGLAQAKRPVELHFQCPEGEHADVHSVSTREEQAGDAPARTTPVGEYRGTEAYALQDGVCRVTTRGSVDTQGMPDVVAAVFRTAANHPTTTLLDARGAVVGLDGIPALAEALGPLLAGMSADLPPQLRAAVDGLVQAMVSEAQLTAQETDTWTQRVGFWAGAGLKPGKRYAIGGTPDLPDRSTFSVEPAPCPGGGECARLHLERVFDEARLSAALPQLLQPMMDALASSGVDVTKVSVSGTKAESRDLLVDPATLRPFEEHEVEVVRVVVTNPGLPAVTQVRTTTADSTWTWPGWSGQP
jgi:hypothetical protein